MDLDSQHVRPLSASSLYSTYKPSRQGRKLAGAKRTPLELLERLIEAGAFADAVQVLAALLRPRELTWWACLCAWHSVDVGASHTEQNALRRAVAWVRQPTATRWQSARAAASEGNIASPALGAARAATLAGGDADRDPDPLIGVAVMTVQRAAAKTREPKKLAEYLQLGIQIAEGRHLWEVAAKPAAGAQPKRFADWAMDSSAVARTAASSLSSGDSAAALPERLQAVVHSLSPRLAVWWACLALGHQQETTRWRMPPAQVKQLNQAVQWVINPDAKPPIGPEDGDATSVGGRLLKAIAMAMHDAPGSVHEAFESAMTAAREESDPTVRDNLLADDIEFASEVREGRRLWPNAVVPRGAAGRSLDWDRWMENSEPVA